MPCGMVDGMPGGIVGGKPACMEGELYILGTGGTLQCWPCGGALLPKMLLNKANNLLSLSSSPSVQLPAWPSDRPGG